VFLHIQADGCRFKQAEMDSVVVKFAALIKLLYIANLVFISFKLLFFANVVIYRICRQTMDHLPTLIQDLALILLVGALVTLLFKVIKQPVVLGYILAGFMVGPHLSLIPTVTDTENVNTLAEIGIIFLLFGLGLEFNIKKLMHIGGPASVTALVEIIFITVAGFVLGRIMGWSVIDSIFLGGMLASSSTTIIIKAFDDLGIRAKLFTRVVFGVLVVEDIVVIFLLVLLPTISVARQFEGSELLITFVKLFAFLVLTFVVGIFLLPPLFKKAKKLLNEETLLILSVGLCLGMVVFATSIGFSAELGAFIMGFILAESTSAEKVEHLIKPVKDLFASVFFVSIGMMIDPALIMKYGWAVLAVSLLTVFGKLFSTSVGALLSGQSLKQSVQVGMSMAQIGEFAFIVATLGLSLGVISDFLFPVAVGASVITTFTTPYLIKYSDKLYALLERKLPGKWITAINNYASGTRSIGSERLWRKVLRSYLTITLTNGVITLTLVFLSLRFVVPFLNGIFQNYIVAGFSCLLATLVIVSPFLWGLMAKRPHDYAYRNLWVNKKYNRGPLVIMEMIRVILGILIIGFLVDSIFSTTIAILMLVPGLFIIMFIFSKQVRKFYSRLEASFLYNLNSKETAVTPDGELVQKQTLPNLDITPWDTNIIEMTVGPRAEYIGKTLEELGWREAYGINLAFIRRGEEIIYSPKKGSRLYPFDKVGIIATEEQMQAFRPAFESATDVEVIDHSVDDVVVQTFRVSDQNLKGLSIAQSGIREKTNGLVIGIERDSERIINPISTEVFKKGDVVWIVGEREKIRKIKEGSNQ
jgi:CPA2 family monovalent cation:H+ antiporter-2